MVKRILLSGLLLAAISACSGSAGTPSPAATTTSQPAAASPAASSETTTESPAAQATESPTSEATEAPTAEATEAPTAEPTEAATAAPGGTPISLSGKGTRKTKPFTMHSPATVALTYSGSGNFISSIEPVGGDVLSSVSLSNTIGKTKFTTHVYEPDIDGVKSFADVIAGDGAWTIKITPGVPAAKGVPASFSGKWGLNTELMSLSGDYTVSFTHAGSGNFIVGLTPSDGDIFGSESIANDIGKVKGSTEVYGLDGEYYFDVIANGTWTISIKPQG